MGYKAKAVAGLLAATCVLSIIALILSIVNVKDVFLSPSTKVGSLGGARLPLGVAFSPGFRLFVTEMGTNSRTGWRARWGWQSSTAALQHTQPFHRRALPARRQMEPCPRHGWWLQCHRAFPALVTLFVWLLEVPQPTGALLALLLIPSLCGG